MRIIFIKLIWFSVRPLEKYLIPDKGIRWFTSPKVAWSKVEIRNVQFQRLTGVEFKNIYRLNLGFSHYSITKPYNLQ